MLRKILKYAISFIIMIVVFLLALIIVSYIPQDFVKDNIKETAEIMILEGEEKTLNSIFRSLYTNNSTDAIMFNLTYTMNSEIGLEALFMARRNFVPGVTEVAVKDTLGDLPHETEEYLMTSELLKTVNNEKQQAYDYARYWHGYVTILRPLSVFFNITTIRWIMQTILIVLLGMLAYYLYKNANFKIAVSVILAFIATDLFVWYTTIQGMFVMILAVGISIFVANKKINDKNINWYLMIVGGLTAYFDFLTTPLVTCLLPILVFNIVNVEKTTVKQEIIKLIKNFFLWGIGYFGVWLVKWILVDIIYQTNIIKLSFEQIYYRMGSYIKTRVENLNILAVFNNVVNSLNVLSIAIYVFLYTYSLLNEKKHKKGYFLTSQKLIYYVCAIIPFIWYYIICEHSYQHYFFTYKNLLITLLSVMLLIVDDRNKTFVEENEGKKK